MSDSGKASAQRKGNASRRTQSRRRLVAAVTRFRDVAAMSADWVWELDVEGRFSYCSERVTDLLGYAVAEVLGQTLFDLMSAEEVARVRPIWEAAWDVRESVTGLSNEKRHKNGAVIYIQTNAVPILDGADNFLGYRGLDRDVSERIRAEQARQLAEEALREDQQDLEEQRMFLRHVVDINPNFVFVRDLNGHFVLANAAIAAAYGTTVADMVGKTDADFNSNAEEVAAIQQGDRDVMASLRDKFIPESLITYQGTQERWVQTIKRPLLDADGVARRVLGVSTDITERKRMEQGVQESWERRGRQVQTSTEVSQEIAAATALDDLFARVVTLVKERFGYYHTQIFRYDPHFEADEPGPQSGAMRLVKGYGETGAAMLAAEHHLAMGRGVVGTAAVTGRPVRASDVAADPYWVPNPFLPHTQGELAVPIKMHTDILGILDVQSDVAGALSEEDQLLLEGLCGQIAIAIRNTQLLEQTTISHQIIEASAVGISLMSLSGEIVNANATLYQLLGVAAVDVKPGQSLLPYYPVKLRTRVQDEIIPLVLKQGRWQGELAVHSGEGVTIPTWENWSLIRDKEGAPHYIVNQITDITEIKQTEALVRDSEARYHALFDQANDAIFLENASEVTLDVNERACQLFGYSRAELLTMKTSDLQHSQPDRTLPIYKNPETGVVQLETPAFRKDGTEIFIEITVTPLDVGGQQFFLSVVRDVTEAHATQAALDQERSLLQTLLKTVPDHIYFKDQESRFIRINRSMAEWLNLGDVALAVGKSDADFFSDEHAQQVYLDEQEIMRTGQALLNVEEKKTWSDGRVAWVSNTKMPLVDKDGALTGTFGISRDITERKQAETVLRETQQLLAGVLENTTAVIYVKDLEGRYMLVNQRYEMLFDVRREDIVGKTGAAVFSGGEAELYWQNDLAVVEAGVSHEYVEHARHVDGEHTYLSLKFLIFDGGGEPYAICSISTDITGREAAESERRRLLRDVENQARELRTTLADISALYRASQAINVATTMDELLRALIIGVELPPVSLAGLNLFNRPWQNADMPEFVEVVAVCVIPEPDGAENAVDLPLSVGQQLTLSEFPVAHLLRDDEPLVWGDISSDPRVDAAARALFVDTWHARSTLFVPLVAAGQWIGFFNPLMQDVVDLDAGQLRRLMTLAGQAATVLQNLRWLEEAQERARHQAALREIATVVSASEGTAGLVAQLDAILLPLRELVPVDIMTISIYTPGAFDVTVFSLVAERPVNELTHRGRRLPLLNSAPGWVIMNRRPWLEGDMRDKRTFMTDARLLAEGIVARVLLPLEFSDQIGGTLNLLSSQLNAYTETDLPMLQQVANQIAQALERTRLLETTRAARDEVAATHRSYLREGWEAYLQKEQALRQTTFIYEQGRVATAAGFAVPEMQAAIQGDVATVEEKGRSGLVIPITVRGQVLGVLGFDDPQGHWRCSDEQLTLIQAVTRQLGEVLENARLIEATQSQASRERLVAEVSSTMSTSLELDAVLRTAAAELCEALGLAEVEVRLGKEEQSSGDL